jgi:hypothetical protein
MDWTRLSGQGPKNRVPSTKAVRILRPENWIGTFHVPM